MSKRQTALISGWSLIMMAILAAFSFGYAFPEFYQPDQINSFKDNILNKKELYRIMLIGGLLILILDLLVSYTLYCYFKNDNNKISLASSTLRIVYTLILGLATYYLTKNLSPIEFNSQLIVDNFKLFQLTWSAGLIIFGIHILLIGILMKLHNGIPKILWCLTLIAGVSYIAVHLLKLTNPNSEFVSTLEIILALPMAVGELGLAIWLIVRGGKEIKPVTDKVLKLNVSADSKDERNNFTTQVKTLNK